MKVTYNWLKDFVDIKIAPKALAGKLTMAGLEVTSLEEKDGDFVFEIEVTSNRPDWLSVIGIAREVAAITGKRLKFPRVTGCKLLATKAQSFSIKVEDKKDCPLYTAKIIKNIKAGPSPDWLKKRLQLVGCRSANDIVDITNYILFEWGEPLHAFDLDKLSGDVIIVRRAKFNEKITTIDGEQRALNPDILVIADEKRPVAVAGVMGGKDSEVTTQTKNILLEAAVFNPVVVRRSRQRLGLQSESAYRFERGVDANIVENASWYAVELIQKLAGGACVLAKTSGLPKTKRKNIILNVSTVQKILGINITSVKIKRVLNGLEFKVKAKAKNNFVVEVPAHRQDVNLEIDLIEEIARAFGYEFIPKSLPAIKPEVAVFQMRDLVTFTKNILAGLGLNEVITYSLTDKDLLRSFIGPESDEAIEILNPLSQEQGILRSRLIPSLVACVAYNLNQQQDYVNIFEISKIFSGSSNQPKEELVLGIALSGAKSWLFEQGLIKEEMGFLHLKGILETLFDSLGIKDYSFSAKDSPSCFTLYVNQEKIGIITRLEKNLLDKFDIKNKDVFALELSLDETFVHHIELRKKFTPLPKYPCIARDISFILKENISVSGILEAIKEKGQPLLSEVKVVDCYKGKQIPAGYRGLTISCLYRAQERTLTEAEINPAHTLICGILTEHFGAKIR